MAPIRVAVSGAAGQVSYSLLFQIASGRVFGPDQKIILQLLDHDRKSEVLSGVAMELQDCAFPLLEDYVLTDDPEIAFKDISAAFLVGAEPRKLGMERKDLLKINAHIFKEQGIALDRVARKDVKVLVVGNPANTNALICSHFAPSIPRENFTALTRLDHNRALGKLAAKIGTEVSNVRNVIVWGNHSSTQYPDGEHAIVHLKNKDVNANTLVDNDYLHGEFLSGIRSRGAVVMAARRLSSALSAATAAADHMRDWWFGTPKDKWVSMGVISDGSYGTPLSVIFSFPIIIENGKWHIVKGLKLSDFGLKMLDITGKELLEEREMAISAVGS